MKLVLMFALLMILRVSAYSKECLTQEDCGKDECCAALHIYHLPGRGQCLKLTKEGYRCNMPDAKQDYFGNKYVLSCPCETGLICRPRGLIGLINDPSIILSSLRCQKATGTSIVEDYIYQSKVILREITKPDCRTLFNGTLDVGKSAILEDCSPFEIAKGQSNTIKDPINMNTEETFVSYDSESRLESEDEFITKGTAFEGYHAETVLPTEVLIYKKTDTGLKGLSEVNEEFVNREIPTRSALIHSATDPSVKSKCGQGGICDVFIKVDPSDSFAGNSDEKEDIFGKKDSENNISGELQDEEFSFMNPVYETDPGLRIKFS